MLEHLALSESGFLFDARTGNTYSLNRTATFMLRLLIDGVPPETLAAHVVEAFDVDRVTAERDAQRFVARLRELGLLADEADAATGAHQ